MALHARGMAATLATSGQSDLQKVASPFPLPRGPGLSSNTWFLGPTRVCPETDSLSIQQSTVHNDTAVSDHKNVMARKWTEKQDLTIV